MLIVSDWLHRACTQEVRWQGRGDIPIVYDGIPFVVLARQRYECLWGPQRGRKYKSTQQVSVCSIK